MADRSRKEDKIINGVIRSVDEAAKIVKAKDLAPKTFKISPTNGKVRALNIKHTKTGQWAVGFDKAGKRPPIDFPHMNVNELISGVKDPHIPISGNALKACEGVAKTAKVLKAANKVLLPIAIAIDTARLGKALIDDFGPDNGNQKKRPRKTITTGGSVAGGWVGGFTGAWGGGALGAEIGTAIGLLFGGVGAIPGAAIGSLVGSLCGAIGGGIGGSFGGEKLGEVIVDELFSDNEDENADDENSEDEANENSIE